MTEFKLTGSPEAPTVTPADVQAAVRHERYFVDETLTICVLTLWNGFKVTGESACASPDKYDKQLGETLARKRAEDKIWMLLGFQLKNELAGIPKL